MNLMLADDVLDARRSEEALESAPIDNVVITRFNLYQPQYTSDWTEGQRNVWSESRFPLFREMCVKSMLNQSEKRFDWLILFDEEQPAFISRAQDELSKMGNAHIMACPRNDLPYLVIKDVVDEFSTRLSAPFICTSRLDCDDSLNREYINNLKLYSKWYFGQNRSAPVVWSFPFGAQAAEDRMFGLTFPHNPFVSLVEENTNDLMNVYVSNHGYIYDRCPTRYLHTKQPMWTQLVHGNNIMNGVYINSVGLDADTVSRVKMFGSSLVAK